MPQSAGRDKVGRSGPSCSLGDGGPPPATLLHSELQAGVGVWQGHRTEAHRALPRRVKLALAKKEEAVSSLRKQHEVGPHGRPSLGERGWLGPDQGGWPVAGRDEEGRPPGGAAGAAQAAVPECQVTTDSSRPRAPGGKCSGRPSGGAPRLRRNSKEVSFNTLCDPDLSLLGWGLGWRGWRLLRARCEVTRPSFALGLPPTFPAWPCGSTTQAPDPKQREWPSVPAWAWTSPMTLVPPHRTPHPWGRSSEPPPRPLHRLLCAPSMVRELASLPEGLSFLPPLRTPPGGDNLEPVRNGHWTGPAHEEAGGPSWKVWAGEREGSGGDTPTLGTLPRCPPARHSVAAAALAEGAGTRSLGSAGAGQDSPPTGPGATLLVGRRRAGPSAGGAPPVPLKGPGAWPLASVSPGSGHSRSQQPGGHRQTPRGPEAAHSSADLQALLAPASPALGYWGLSFLICTGRLLPSFVPELIARRTPGQSWIQQ